MVNLNSENLVRQCQECGLVYLADSPAADRIPRTCPNDCGAAVLHLRRKLMSSEWSLL